MLRIASLLALAVASIGAASQAQENLFLQVLEKTCLADASQVDSLQELAQANGFVPTQLSELRSPSVNAFESQQQQGWTLTYQRRSPPPIVGAPRANHYECVLAAPVNAVELSSIVEWLGFPPTNDSPSGATFQWTGGWLARTPLSPLDADTTVDVLTNGGFHLLRLARSPTEVTVAIAEVQLPEGSQMLPVIRPVSVSPLYPDRAWTEQVGGRAEIQCDGSRNLTLSNCRLISEAPEGYGFGQALLEAASRSALDIRNVTISGARSRASHVFRPDERPALSNYPERAEQLEVTGSAWLACTVGAGGRLTDCRAIEDSFPGIGFSEAAVRTAPYFRVSPDQSQPRVQAGDRVEVLVRFAGLESGAKAESESR